MGVSTAEDVITLQVSVCTDLYGTVTDWVDTLEQIRKYLNKSSHKKDQIRHQRQELGRCLEPILQVCRNVLKSADNLTPSAHPYHDKSKANQNVSNRLTWEVIDSNAKGYNENSTISITIERSHFNEVQNWEKNLQDICEQLMVSKANKKKSTIEKFSRYAPGILFLLRAVHKSYQAIKAASSGDDWQQTTLAAGNSRGDHQGEGELKRDHEGQVKDKWDQQGQGEAKVYHQGEVQDKGNHQKENPGLLQSSRTRVATVSPLPSKQESHSPPSEKKTGQNENSEQKRIRVEADADVAKDKERQSVAVDVHHIQVAEPAEKHDVVAEPDSETSRAGQEHIMVATAAALASMEYTPSGNQEESTDSQRVSSKKKKDKPKEKEKDEHLSSSKNKKDKAKEKEKSEQMSSREKMIEEQKLNVEQQENKVAQREKAVNERERELTDRAEKLKQYETDQAEREKDIAKQERKLTDREQKLKQDETNKGNREKDLEKQYNEQLNQLKHQLQEQKKISEDLRQRLSKEMGVKISANESSVENISIKHRPMTIADDYINFQSNEWYEAKVCVDEHLTPSSVEERVSVLSHMLQITEDTVKGALDKLNEVLKNVLLQPATCAATEMKVNVELSSLSQTSGHMYPLSLTPGQLRSSLERDTRSTIGHMGDFQKKLSPAVTNTIGDFLRVEVDNCDYKLLIKLTTTKIAEKCKPIQSVITYEPIESYIAAMVRLCWMMTIQRPPMTFDFQRTRLSDKYQTLFWGSKVKEDAEVYVVHPVLKHGDRVMAKGQIYLAEHQHSVATTV